MKKQAEWPVSIHILAPHRESEVIKQADLFTLKMDKDYPFTGEVTLGLCEVLVGGENFLPLNKIEERMNDLDVSGSWAWRHFEENLEENIPTAWKEKGYSLFFRNFFRGVNPEVQFLLRFYVNGGNLWRHRLTQITGNFVPPPNSRFVCVI